jgi:hypothetical protein
MDVKMIRKIREIGFSDFLPHFGLLLMIRTRVVRGHTSPHGRTFEEVWRKNLNCEEIMVKIY